MIAGDTPIGDILLPHSDRTALIQVLVVLVITGLITWAVRSERVLVQLSLGVGSVLLGLMAMRTLH